MSDEVEFQMTYPCYFLCGDRGGLVCITVNSVTCLCLFTTMAKLYAFQRGQETPTTTPGISPKIAFAACDNADELTSRLKAAETELKASKVQHLAINPAPGEPVAFITIREFVAALPRD